MIRIRKQQARGAPLDFPFPGMWVGECDQCKGTKRFWQFWYFGATLGYGLEHIRRHHG